ncbi:MAG: outer membrane lipoprotein carrier protein LolA [Desulfobacteraceae bacterium]|nr:outer membrane lipoprotein carrier protein LolA [Desulfobacteraceae bacterium]
MQKMKERTLQSFLNKYLLVTFILSALIFSAFVQEINATTLDQFLDGLEKRYSQQDFIADFSQVSKLKALGIDETASGKAMFSHPGKMIWEYFEPQQHQMITNGKMLWIYRPDQNQVMVGKAQNFFKEGSGGAFLSDISIVREKYIINIKENREKFFELILIPKIKTPEIQSIGIIVSKKDFNIEKIITTNIYKDTIEIEFQNIEFKKINGSAFEFSIPEDSSVIDIDSQVEN